MKTISSGLTTQILDTVPDPIFVLDHHRIVLANDAFYRFFGRCREDVIERLAKEVVPGSDLPLPNPAALFRTSVTEEVIQDGRGAARTVIITRSIGRDDNGNPILVGVMRDITDQKQTATALQVSEQRYRMLFNSGNDAAFVHPPFHPNEKLEQFVEVNDVACRRLGYSREELLKLTPRDIDAPEAQADLPLHLARFEAEGMAVWEGMHVTKQGARIPVQIHAHKFELNGQPMVLSEVRDLTERKEAEKALRQSEHRYRSLFTNMVEGLAYCHVLFVDGKADDLIYLSVNSSFTHLTGLKNVEGRRLSEVIPGIRVSDPQLLERYGSVARTGVADRFEMHVAALKMWFSISVYSPLQDHIVVVFDVITERKLAERELRTLSRAVEQSPVSIVITDPKGFIEYVNPKFVQVTGYTADEAVGKNPRILKSGRNPDELYSDLWATVLSGREWHGELCNKKKNGELFWESASISSITNAEGEIIHFLAVKEDITAHKKLETEFRQAQKMEGFGRLAAGVAHDFNNLMTSVLCSTALLEMDPLNPDQQDLVNEISHAAKRAASLTRQLLMFSRRQAVQLQALELNEVVENMGKMLRRLIGEHITLKTYFRAESAPVFADPGMLEQVLVNLAVNSRDAMPKGGELSIETGRSRIEQPTARRKKGSFVRLSVSDTGCGIPQENIEHIFEPFFTTKEFGKGTGLGLATVFGIVEQHKGWIEVESEANQGTAFHVFLPLHEADGKPAALPPDPGQLSGTETILLVEDDASLRGLAGNILRQHGYRVYDAESGKAALALWAQHEAQIELLFTDIVMPGNMDGVELSQTLLASKPQLKVVYTSGYTDDMLDERSVLRQAQNFIEKPYLPDALLRKIREGLR